MDRILILENQAIIMEGLLCSPNIDNSIKKKMQEQILSTKIEIMHIKKENVK